MGSPGYVQLQGGAEYPVAYVQSIPAEPAQQGTAWSDIAMLAVAGAAVGAAIGNATKARAGDAQMIELPDEFNGIWTSTRRSGSTTSGTRKSRATMTTSTLLSATMRAPCATRTAASPDNLVATSRPCARTSLWTSCRRR